LGRRTEKGGRVIFIAFAHIEVLAYRESVKVERNGAGGKEVLE